MAIAAKPTLPFAPEMELPKGVRPKANAWRKFQSTRPPKFAGRPQAVIKVLSYRKGGAAITDSLRYIGRDNEVDRERLEMSDGTELRDRDDIRDVAEQWSRDQRRADGRVAVHFTISFPAEVDREKARAITRDALPDFAGGRDYAFAIHSDTDHVHAHVVMRLRDPEGRMLRISPERLQAWRERLVERARERDAELYADQHRPRERDRPTES